VHQVIYDELCIGKVECASRTGFLCIISELSAQGVEAVILGRTELGMLLNQSDTPIPLFDTTAIHSAKAIAWALSD
jgi:aspartate racemase